jgi:hypothetical protein
MQKAKRQHTVPRCYLARFCKDGQRLYAFDKTDQRSFLTSVMNVAQERYFYDMPADLVAKAFPGQEIDVQFVEKSFAQTEGLGNSLLKEVLEYVERKGVMARAHRLSLAPYIIVQWLRTRLHRDLLLEMKEKLINGIKDELMRKNFPEVPQDQYPSVEFDKRFLPVFHAQQFFDEDEVVELAAILNRHIWFVGLNRTIQPYYTSDHPVVKKANCHHPRQSFNGLRSPGIEIAFPLSSRHILVMLERSHFRKLERLDGGAFPMDAFGVEHFNCLQVMKSHRQVYCESDQFEQAEGVCRRHPEMCEPGRPMVQVTQTDDLMRMLILD